ncbi:hypothetical protein [Umezakia ovalisporum]|uniref:hypothetical protein n=1 Tax=Umezakia ovalisporum TaxID=75695 RepID=UPI0026B89F5F
MTRVCLNLPLRNPVLIKISESEVKNPGGIPIPDKAKENPKWDKLWPSDLAGIMRMAHIKR